MMRQGQSLTYPALIGADADVAVVAIVLWQPAHLDVCSPRHEEAGARISQQNEGAAVVRCARGYMMQLNLRSVTVEPSAEHPASLAVLRVLRHDEVRGVVGPPIPSGGWPNSFTCNRTTDPVQARISSRHES